MEGVLREKKWWEMYWEKEEVMQTEPSSTDQSPQNLTVQQQELFKETSRFEKVPVSHVQIWLESS